MASILFMGLVWAFVGLIAIGGLLEALFGGLS